MDTQRTILRIAGIAALGTALGTGHSLIGRKIILTPKAPEPLVIEGETPPPSAAGQPPSKPGTPRPTSELDITLAQAFALFQRGNAFIDARRRDEYEAGHVRDAFFLPAELFSGGARPEAMEYLVPTDDVVIYCGGGLCDASKNVAVMLQQFGFTRCRIMHEGYPAWASAGHPTATGKPVYEGN
jgi:rhodanese-related sulfurtransferase